MTDKEDKQNSNDRPVNRQEITQLRRACSQAVLEISAQFVEFRNSNERADNPRRDLLENSEKIEDVMLQSVLGVFPPPYKNRSQKWSAPVAKGGDELTLDNVRTRLAASRQTFMESLRETPGIRDGTPEVVVELYDKVLQMVGVTIDRLQDPVGEATLRATIVWQPTGKGK